MLSTWDVRLEFCCVMGREWECRAKGMVGLVLDTGVNILRRLA